MGFEGFVLGGVAILIVVVVIPTLTRQRTTLASAPIEDRYSEDLRMLSVERTPARILPDSGEERGSVFYRRPEVEMAGDAAAVDVRGLARERAQIRARMSERAANLQRGFYAACGLGILSIILWIAVSVTSLSIMVPVVSTAIGVAYIGAYVWLVNKAAAAEDADRAALAKIDSMLPRNGRTRKNRHAHARRLAVREAATKRTAMEAAKSAEVEAGGSDVAEPVDGERTEVSEAPSRAAAAHREVAARRAQAAKSESAAAAQTSKVERDADAPARRDADVSARRDADVSAARETRAASEPVSMPSYTLKPRTFARRVVDPYVEPEQASAPVPYRPQEIGERYDAATGVVKAGEVPTEVVRHSTEVLSGGSVLDELLERRRA